MAKYNKLKEKNYDYWQNLFDGHGGYMLAGGGNEYDILRRLLLHFVCFYESFLDIGCACGDNLEVSERLKLFLKYKGTDYVEKFIKANKKRRPEIDWEVMDARYLKEEDGSYDNVCLYDVLDGLEGWELALSEASRVATKRVIVLMWMDPAMEDKLAYMRKLGLRCIDIKIEGDGLHFHRLIVGEK
jgi:2-polyprenyl-3-methyl-5-hydroxy-6-metoxy-1,4-benzoquinol methylase